MTHGTTQWVTNLFFFIFFSICCYKRLGWRKLISRDVSIIYEKLSPEAAFNIIQHKTIDRIKLKKENEAI